MSILESLTLSEVSKRGDSTLPHLLLRRKMVAAIDEQIGGATAEAAGQHFSKTVAKTVKNEETGAKERRTVQRSLRRWWWIGTDGLMLELKFGNRAIKVGGKSSIVVGDPCNLVLVLQKVREAVVAGELDPALKTASDGRKRVKKDGKPVGTTGKPPAAKSAK